METNVMKNSIIYIFAFMLILTTALPAMAQRSLYRDNKASQIGDVITVVLVENISGSSTRDERATSNQSGQLQGSLGGNIMPLEPFFSSDASVSSNMNSNFLANQQQLLQGNLSVRIIDVTPNGDLVVEGSRSTEINGEKHWVKLSGLVRPSDVDNTNSVLSFRVANAEISYLKEESLQQAWRRPGKIRRAVMYGIGATLVGAVLLREFR